MKILAKIAVLALCAGIPAMAQGQDVDPAKALQRMTKVFNLSADQQTKMAEALKLPRGPERRKAIAAVLTPEQRQKAQAMAKARRERREKEKAAGGDKDE